MPLVQGEVVLFVVLAHLVTRDAAVPAEEVLEVLLGLLNGPGELLRGHGLGIVADVGVVLFPNLL